MARRERVKRLLLAVPLLLVCGAVSQAQTVPDAGQLLRENERQQRLEPPPTVPEAPPAAPVPPPPGETRFIVKKFRVTGVTLLRESEVQAALTPYLNHEITFADLDKALLAVSQLYQRHGWLARPQLPAQDVVDGIVTINVIEGRLGEIHVKDVGAPRLSDERVINTMTARQQGGEPLDLNAMDRAINLLNNTPGGAVSATLAPGAANAMSDIIVTVDEKPLASGSATIDNAGSRSTGPWRLNLNGNLNSPARFGDKLGANVIGSEGEQYARLGYSLPVGYDGWRVGVNSSMLVYELGSTFAPLHAKGDAQTVGLDLSYPLLLGTSDNVNLSFGFTEERFNNEASGAVTSRKAVHVGNLTLGGDSSDGLGGGGLVLWNASLVAGDVDLSGNLANQEADQAGPRTGGAYGRFAANVARLQRLTDKDSLWLSLSGQAAFKNLDSSEKFSLGGPQGVRAYPVFEGTGDTGWIATIEPRHNFTPEWQVSAFFDHGAILVNQDNGFNSGGGPNYFDLNGVGASVSYTLAGKASVRLTLARRVGRNPIANPRTGDDSDGSHDVTRLWLSAVAYF